MDTQQLAELKRYILNIEDNLKALKRIVDINDTGASQAFSDDVLRQPYPSRLRARDPYDQVPPSLTGSRPPFPQRASASQGLGDGLPSRRPAPLDPAADPKPIPPSLYPPFAAPRPASRAVEPVKDDLGVKTPVPETKQVTDSTVSKAVDTQVAGVSQQPSSAVVRSAPATQTTTQQDSSQNSVVEGAKNTVDISGKEGSFDGSHLLTPTGERFEVPQNYVAETRILYGDIVKMYEENGEKKFKITTKQPSKKVNALTTRKEGKWFALTGLGSYRLSDGTADFNKLEVNQEIAVLLPENNLAVPFATFDEVIKPQLQAASIELPNASIQAPSSPNAQATPSQTEQAPAPTAVQGSEQKQAPVQKNAAKKLEDYDLV